MTGAGFMQQRAPTGMVEVSRLVGRHKLLLLIPTVAGLGLAWLIIENTPHHYTAEATLALDARKTEIVANQVVSPLPLENMALRTELDIIASRSLAEQVVDRFDLAKDAEVLRQLGRHGGVRGTLEAVIPSGVLVAANQIGLPVPVAEDRRPAEPSRSDVINWVISNLKVSNDGRSLTILVSFTSEDPQHAVQVANAIAETYLDQQVKMKLAATTKANEWLGERLVGMRQELQAAEAKVDEFRQASGLVEAKGGTVAGQRLSELSTQLGNARLERQRAEAKLQASREGETIADVLASPLSHQLRKDLANLSVMIVEAKSGKNYLRSLMLPELEQRAATLQKQIDLDAKRVTAGLLGEVETARKTEQRLAGIVKVLEAQSEANTRLNQLQREADASRSIYESFLARYKQTIEQQGLAMPDARLVSRADLGFRIDPRRLSILLIGTLCGLIIGAALTWVREKLDQRVNEGRRIEETTGIPVFGMLPKVSWWKRSPPQDYLVKAPWSPFSTALRHTHVALLPSTHPKRVLVLTSTQAGEGKTSFCVSLARSLAKSQVRALVIDADSHRPSVASRFGGKPTPNLGLLLEGGVRLGDIVQTDPQSSAHFIAAARGNEFDSVIVSQRFANLLAEARSTYDVILFDTPPILASPDAALVGRFADALLLVVRCGRTTWDMIIHAVQYLKLCCINVDGIIVSHVGVRDTYYCRISSRSHPPLKASLRF